MTTLRMVPVRCAFPVLLRTDKHLLFYLTFHHSSPSPNVPHSHFRSASSSPSNASSIQEFLEKSCGLPQTEAILASKTLVHLKTTRNPEQVLAFFEERGFSSSHIRKIVTRRPEVLASSVTKTLQPKVRALEGLGIAGKQLGLLLSRDSAVLGASLKKKLLPSISFLQKLVESDDNVVKVVMRVPWLLHSDLDKCIKPKLLLLQKYGVDRELLSKIFTSMPRLFMSSESLIKDVLNTVEKLGVSIPSGMFRRAVLVVSCMKKSTLERRINLLVGLGLTREEVLLAFRKLPCILGTSDEKLQGHMGFLVKTLKYEPSVVVRYPQFLGTSMEAKIIPRYRVLKMLQSMELLKRNFNAIHMLSTSEKIFLEKFVFKYGESSGLYAIYKGIDIPDIDLNGADGECREMEPRKARVLSS